MAETNKSLTLKLSLSDRPSSSIIDIDPIARVNLINEKHTLKVDQETQTNVIQKKNKSTLIKTYKEIAEKLNKLVKSNKKVHKPCKNAQTISFDVDDLVYDISKYENTDQSNHIIIDDIEDSKLKINISNIINKEIEKNTQMSNASLNNISSSFKQIPSSNPAPPSFATPADKVINFNPGHPTKHSKPLDDIDEQPLRKRKMNAGISTGSKTVSFDLNNASGSLGETSKPSEKGLSFIKDTDNSKSALSFGLADDSKGTSGFGLKRNKDSEEVKSQPAFSFGSTTEKKDESKPAFSFGLNNEKKEESKPAFSFGSTAENKDESKPAFSFGSTAEKKDESKPAFSFGLGAEKKDDSKPALSFGLNTEKKGDAEPAFSFSSGAEQKDESKPALSFGSTNENKDDAKPAFSFGSNTEKKDDAKPAFSFGSNTEKKDDAKPAFAFGSTTEKKDDAKPAFAFGTTTEKKEEPKPAFSFGSNTEKKEDAKPAFTFGSNTEKKDDAKPAFSFDSNSEKKDDTKPAFAFGTITEKKEDTKPAFAFDTNKPSDAKSAFSFGQSAANNDSAKPPNTTSVFNNADDASKPKPASRFEGFGTSSDSTKPKSRFDATPVNPPATSAPFSFGTNTTSNAKSVGTVGNPLQINNNSSAVSPFGNNNSSSVPNGNSRFESTPPITQQGGVSPNPTNPDVFKPVSGFNFKAPAQPNLLSGFSSNTASQSPVPLNFNINSKFKSMSPPQQPQGFQPGPMNFSFGGTLPAGNANGTLPQPNNGMNGFGGMNTGSNMSFGGFGGSQPANNGAVNGRRIAKLRKR
jgi:hypothetical protein